MSSSKKKKRSWQSLELERMKPSGEGPIEKGPVTKKARTKKIALPEPWKSRLEPLNKTQLRTLHRAVYYKNEGRCRTCPGYIPGKGQWKGKKEELARKAMEHVKYHKFGTEITDRVFPFLEWNMEFLFHPTVCEATWLAHPEVQRHYLMMKEYDGPCIYRKFTVLPPCLYRRVPPRPNDEKEVVNPDDNPWIETTMTPNTGLFSWWSVSLPMGRRSGVSFYSNWQRVGFQDDYFFYEVTTREYLDEQLKIRFEQASNLLLQYLGPDLTCEISSLLICTRG